MLTAIDISVPVAAPFAPTAAPPVPLDASALSARRTEILAGLRKIILNEGFRGLRLTDVAKRLNTSYTTLYQLAPTKDELVLLVVDRWYQESIAGARHLLGRAATPVDRLQAWVGFGVAGVSATTPVFWHDVSTHAGLRSLVRRYQHYYVEVLEQIVEEGIAAGVFRPVNARVLSLMWESAAARLSEGTDVGPLSLREQAEAWVDVVLHGLLQ